MLYGLIQIWFITDISINKCSDRCMTYNTYNAMTDRQTDRQTKIIYFDQSNIHKKILTIFIIRLYVDRG